jgi:hypothetical protein
MQYSQDNPSWPSRPLVMKYGIGGQQYCAEVEVGFVLPCFPNVATYICLRRLLCWAYFLPNHYNSSGLHLLLSFIAPVFMNCLQIENLSRRIPALLEGVWECGKGFGGEQGPVFVLDLYLINVRGI